MYSFVTRLEKTKTRYLLLKVAETVATLSHSVNLSVGRKINLGIDLPLYRG
jgi:hypothetical protein